MSSIKFKIEKKLPKTLARAGVLKTPHGEIQTPAFVTVGTKATVKSLAPEQIKETGSQVVLANTYHLYLQPGTEVLEKADGLNKFMNWDCSTMTDSGGFQVFSLGVAFGEHVSKIAKDCNKHLINKKTTNKNALAKVDEDGVIFKSHIDGSKHKFTPEISMRIQHSIGADIMFAFDECTSPQEPYEYQKKAMERTHRWAKRSLDEHKKNKKVLDKQALFGIVQGGRYEILRKKSAKTISMMDFDGFGIGGSFDKNDMGKVIRWVNEILPEEKPRHLLGIGNPLDLFGAIENGCDLFDCVDPTRIARNGTLHTRNGKINIFNTRFKKDFLPVEKNCNCYTCKNYTKAYLSHLFRSREIFANTLASIHNLYFINNLVAEIRKSILDETFFEFKNAFNKKYKS